MGVSANLRVNAENGVDDVVKVLEERFGKVKVESNHKTAFGFFTLSCQVNGETTSCSLWLASKFSLGVCTHLSTWRTSENELLLLETVLQALGGMLEKNDFEGTWIELETNNVIACQEIKELNNTLKDLKLIISCGQGVEV